jgi:hypothetical protein
MPRSRRNSEQELDLKSGTPKALSDTSDAFDLGWHRRRRTPLDGDDGCVSAVASRFSNVGVARRRATTLRRLSLSGKLARRRSGELAMLAIRSPQHRERDRESSDGSSPIGGS